MHPTPRAYSKPFPYEEVCYSLHMKAADYSHSNMLWLNSYNIYMYICKHVHVHINVNIHVQFIQGSVHTQYCIFIFLLLPLPSHPLSSFPPSSFSYKASDHSSSEGGDSRSPSRSSTRSSDSLYTTLNMSTLFVSSVAAGGAADLSGVQHGTLYMYNIQYKYVHVIHCIRWYCSFY